ncbi:hypothetical protein ISF_04663 [Cordyceps fumosorosea ARSEF 2679]|uniref:DUF2406 domain protein n=1 Tax=Cordyceps fumosorosea (strain ARSEF 2679) TaxID=1081104 RepID=A0A167WLW8_CORFA|nr:hypothetical protein ISF_04663 [Cordyceps fumosorosea ARSEF 2679]OAA63954.1 hypothetical protein ISF_04663 [Cordyceps fumosorosea ARSEF 2679]
MAGQPGQQHFSSSQDQRQQPPAGFQYYQEERSKPRSFSVGSEHSKKSHKSQKSASSQKEYETSAEKETHRLHSKADPLVAMYEAEPSMVAAMASDTNTAPLRSFQHKDLQGNVITDPDRSNPTRSRWERPLDTIRSFEAAINGGYQRRSTVHRDEAANWNRRTSMSTFQQPRFPQDSYYGNNSRPISYRDSQTAPSTRRNSGFFDGQGFRPPRRDYEQQHVYPLPNKDRSYETVTSAAGSGHTDPAGYQTDPTSSDNSSIRRASPTKRQEPINDYGIGFAHPQSNLGFTQPQQQAHPLPPAPVAGHEPVPPPVPRKGSFLKRQPTQEKRKSWLSRRFSKN